MEHHFAADSFVYATKIYLLIFFGYSTSSAGPAAMAT
jgi:hypothetical protein